MSVVPTLVLDNNQITVSCTCCWFRPFKKKDAGTYETRKEASDESEACGASAPDNSNEEASKKDHGEQEHPTRATSVDDVPRPIQSGHQATEDS